MSTETNIMPEVDQSSAVSKPEKKERNYNGIYRRNNRMRKTDKDETTPETVTEQSSNVVEEKNQPKVKVEIKVKARSRKTSLNTTEEESQPKVVTKKTSRKNITEAVAVSAEPSLEEPLVHEANKATVISIVNDEDNKTETKITFIENKEKEAVNEVAETTEIVETTQAEPVVSVRSAFHELLYLIRQKNAYNHNEFFLELEKVLEIMPFTEIKESNLSLFGFACMYDREIIFQKLCQDYSKFIEQEDLESIMKICFTKREETVGNLIKIYSDKFKPQPEFIKELFTAMSISSYREKNNIQILEWIAPYITEDEYEVFWNKCIEYRNISLINTAMHVLAMKENLQKNLEKYIDGFKLIGREHTIKLALNREYRKITVNPISTSPLPSIRKSYLADNNEQLKSIQQDEEGKQPVVSFKNARKSAES